MMPETPGKEFGADLATGKMVVGVDEAGRGPLAGPVVAAAVLLGQDYPAGIDDSKKLTANVRARLYDEIRASCVCGIAVVDVQEIDRLNIFGATMLAMSLAVGELCTTLGRDDVSALIDGNLTPQGRCERWRWPARAIVGGDGKEASIGAASILAKHYRDKMMEEAARNHPQYGWERNKGYGTKDHIAALRKYGPSPLHRRSFAPVAQMEMIV